MASSDAIIRNTYRQVTGQEAPDSVLRAARAVPDNELESFIKGGAKSGDPAADFINSILDEITKPLKEATERAGQFDRENPFVFDEVLARESAEERLSPYYEAELRDFLTGVTRARGRTLQDEQRLRTELDTTTETTSARIRANVEETIRSSEEGFAGSGLLSSGARERTTGMQEIQGEENLSDFMRKQTGARTESQIRESRNLEDIATKEATGIRTSQAAKETALSTDVLGQKTESAQKRELERQNFIGYPLAGGTNSLQSIFGL
jgi:uncharacterized protein with von Willebrand factor type A (vWA) domain